MEKGKVIAYIFNHNHNENSKLWLDRLTSAGVETYIIDSGSDEPMEDDHVLKYENLMYGGCYVEMCRLLEKTDAEWALQINDDIEIDDDNFKELIKSIGLISKRSDMGIYQPSTTEESHNVIPRNINKGSGKIRYTYRIEGWMGLIHRDILTAFKLFVKDDWKIGWGMDLFSSFLSWGMRKAVVVDDTVIVKHAKGAAGYDTHEADREMENFFKKHFDSGFSEIEKRTFTLFKKYVGLE